MLFKFLGVFWPDQAREVTDAVRDLAGPTVLRAEDAQKAQAERLEALFAVYPPEFRTKAIEHNGVGTPITGPYSAVSDNDANLFSPKESHGYYWQRYFQYLVTLHSKKPDRAHGDYPIPDGIEPGILSGRSTVPTNWIAKQDFNDATPALVEEISAATQTTIRAWHDEIHAANRQLGEDVRKEANKLEALKAEAEWTLKALASPENPPPRPQILVQPTGASGTSTALAMDVTSIVARLAKATGTTSPQVRPRLLKQVLQGVLDRHEAFSHALSKVSNEGVRPNVPDLAESLEAIADEIERGSLRKAWWVFENVFIATYKAEQDEAAGNEILWRRLRGGERVPRREITDVQFDNQIWPEAVRGGVRIIMDNKGDMQVRLARAGELAPAAPFRYWRVSDLFKGIFYRRGDLPGNVLVKEQEHDQPATGGGPVALPPDAGLLRYLDWSPLPHRAINPQRTVTAAKVLKQNGAADMCSLTFSADATENRGQLLIDFAGRVSGRDVLVAGHGTKGTAASSAIRERLFRDILSLPGIEVLDNWLAELAKKIPREHHKYGITATVDHSGFIAICIVVPPDLESTDLIPRHTADALALSMAHLVKFAVDRDAVGDGGPDLDVVRAERLEDNEAYGLHTALIEPTAVSLSHLAPESSLEDNSRNMLEIKHLATMEVRRRDTSFVARGKTIFEANAALVELSSRFGRVLDRNLPQLIEDQPEQSKKRNIFERLSTRQNHDDEGGAQKASSSYRAISFYFSVSSWLLVVAFALFCIAPSFEGTTNLVHYLMTLAGISDPPAFALTTREIQWLCLIFFVLSLLRLFAAYGLSRVVHQKREEGHISWLGITFRQYARVFFSNQIVAVWDILLFCSLAAVMLFNISGPWPDWVYDPEPLQSSGVLAASTTFHATFVKVLTAILWALPAISVGIVQQSILNLASTVSELQDETGESVALRKLNWVRETAARYNAHLEHLFGASGRGNSHRGNIGKMLTRLPKFDHAEAALKRAEERVQRLVETRRQGYLQNSALTVAVVAFLSGLGPIKELKPDDPGDGADTIAQDRLLNSIRGLEQQFPQSQSSLDPDTQYASLSNELSSTLLLAQYTTTPLVDHCRDPLTQTQFKNDFQIGELRRTWADREYKTFEERGLKPNLARLHLDYLSDLHTLCQRVWDSKATNSQLAKLAEAIGNLRPSGGSGENPPSDNRTVNVQVLIEKVLSPDQNISDPEAYIRHILTGGDGIVEVDAEVSVPHPPKGPIGPVKPVEIPLVLHTPDPGELRNQIRILQTLLLQPSNRLQAELNIVPSNVLQVLAKLNRELADAQAEPLLAGPSVPLTVTTPKADDVMAQLRDALEKLVDDGKVPSIALQLDPKATSEQLAALAKELAASDPLLVPGQVRFEDADVAVALDNLRKAIERASVGDAQPKVEIGLRAPDGAEVRRMSDNVQDALDEAAGDASYRIGLRAPSNADVGAFVEKVKEALDRVGDQVEYGITLVPEGDGGWPPGCPPGADCPGPEVIPEPQASLRDCKRVASFFFRFDSADPNTLQCSEFAWGKSDYHDGWQPANWNPAEGSCQFDEVSGDLVSPIEPDQMPLTVRERLRRVAQEEELRAIKERDAIDTQQLVVVGYADSNGARSVNARLARDRARRLKDWLMDDWDITRISAIGRGEEPMLPDSYSGLLPANPYSRRADVLHCKPRDV